MTLEFLSHQDHHTSESRWGEGSLDRTRMAKRLTSETEPAFRGVLRMQDARTQEITYKFLGPYRTKGSTKGIISHEINKHNRYPNRAGLIIVGAKVQQALGWEDLDEGWIEV